MWVGSETHLRSFNEKVFLLGCGVEVFFQTFYLILTLALNWTSVMTIADAS